MTTTGSRISGKGIRVAMATAALSALLTGSALAQAPAAAAPTPPDPNPGALTFTANADALIGTPYIFRGIVQEADPKFTLWPSADIGFALYSGMGGVKTVALDIAMWHSLQTGSSGLDAPANKLHYEEDFLTTLTLGFAHGASLATTYTAYTSPNAGFATVHELMFKVAVANKVNPYGIIAQELGENGADGGAKKGTYVELGIGPSWPLGGGKATLAIPVKVGLSAHNYYELAGVDNKFGYLDVGGLVTVPLSGVNPNFGGWNFHIGVDGFAFGDTTKAFNAGKKGKGTFLFGFGVTY